MSRERKVDLERERNLADDQREHGYYYDDAYGYEPFDPEDDREAAADEDEKKPDLDS